MIMEKDSKSEIHITNNFNAPIGQHIDHVDTINFRMDGDGTFHFGMVENVKEEPRKTDVDRLVRAATRCQSYFWAASAYAVVYGVCRDCFGYAGSMSQFERDFSCTAGTLSGAFRNNDFLQYHVDRWREKGAKERVLKLVENYRKAVNELMEK